MSVVGLRIPRPSTPRILLPRGRGHQHRSAVFSLSESAAVCSGINVPEHSAFRELRDLGSHQLAALSTRLSARLSARLSQNAAHSSQAELTARGSEHMTELTVSSADLGDVVEQVGEALSKRGYFCVEVDEKFTVAAETATKAMIDWDKTCPENGSYSRREPHYSGTARQTARSFAVVRGEAEWPSTEFREVIEKYLLTVKALGLNALLGRLLSQRFDVDDAFLCRNATSESNQVLRAMVYPGTMKNNVTGIAAHTDYELYTVIYQTTPGLELRVDSTWKRPRASVIVLSGDAMDFISSGLFPAAQHRVPRLSQDRASLVFFQPLNDSICLAPLPNHPHQKRRRRLRLPGDGDPPLRPPPPHRTQLDYILDRDHAAHRRRNDLCL